MIAPTAWSDDVVETEEISVQRRVMQAKSWSKDEHEKGMKSRTYGSHDTIWSGNPRYRVPSEETPGNPPAAQSRRYDGDGNRVERQTLPRRAVSAKRHQAPTKKSLSSTCTDIPFVLQTAVVRAAGE